MRPLIHTFQAYRLAFYIKIVYKAINGYIMQNLLIGILFIGLMLIAAGVGAFAAGRSDFGMIFGIAGAAVLVISIVFLVILRKRRAG